MARRAKVAQRETLTPAVQHEFGLDRPSVTPAIRRNSSAPSLSRLDDGLPKIVIGICAMDKKARSKQMNHIVERLLRYGEFDVVVFSDSTILTKPVDEWPLCDCLLCWHSDGFPLKKAQQYAALRKPYLVNDVMAQDTLLDRRRVYRTLMDSGIPVPQHIIVDRENLPQGQTDPEGFMETEDYVELKGVRICKPFVEKPASGEDHNVYIYYPHSMGGGVKRLFRKVDNRSGDYDPSDPGNVRRKGSFIYEEFLTTGGTDVKVYTVGPRYAHAEARKSPVVDGKVVRTADGKEQRFPVLLTPQEKEIARMVVLAFGQRVCGFDLLRSERGRSYVCDVNGWSFVKNSHKYYDDAAGILRMVILSAVQPHRLLAAPPQPLPQHACGDVVLETVDGSQHGMHYNMSMDDMRSQVAGEEDKPEGELRCVLAVIRHGDRTPKQKMKMKVTQEPLLALLHKYLDSKGKQAKLKSPNELQDLLDATRLLLDELEAKQRAAADAVNAGAVPSPEPDSDELREKFRIMKTVLEQGGQFAGINRKVQLKPLRWSAPEERSGEQPRCVEALLILKHGGVLTHSGRQQAETLGNLFRNVMYPPSAGGGLLRLHSTYRHDLKIYSSDEGRVQTSAAAFTKGLLDLEGSALTPILVSLVKKDAGMLDAFGKGASADIQLAKQELYAQMTWDPATNTSMYTEPQLTTPMVSPPLSPKLDPKAMQGASNIPGRPHIYPMPDNPLGLLRQLHELLKLLVDQLRQKCLEEPRNDDRPRGYSALTQDPRECAHEEGKPCSGEKLLLVFDRWRKLAKAFYNEKKNQFDISKVPDIYDAAKYDAIHNQNLGLDLRPVYSTARALAAAVIPNEYGIHPAGKLRIGSMICSQLLGKLLADLASMREESMQTAGLQHADNSLQYDAMADLRNLAVNSSSRPSGGSEAGGGEAEGTARSTSQEEVVGTEPDDGDDDAVLHRLCPTYAQDINSPFRHVRTRIYFTSESHMHSLLNVLRFCQLGHEGEAPLLGEEGQQVLHECRELDYMTHIVLRMFENITLPLDDPKRFRVEVLFSPGAAYDPTEVIPPKKDHVLPVAPRVPLHPDGANGVPLARMESMVKSFAKPFKRQGDPYAPGLRSTVLSTQQSEAAAAGVVAGEGELYQQLT
ncbi:hypothetical protein CHLNCDRAFT_57228 [Chlorella variabilis]|uniref:Inositol hexakisphosphate and diphosphoinositol-pentakisphosphate kinase n=1 Tax=Chlorella variabilis TaxID=554065 RepID=E1Z905_CHLVA|nr:hypothetical protein CHLNCDRAFT_57228 [Chlorella variabilis]EFN57696.1 hypothetical protein CHLNCDRAFT_57228 [Chlorella variabilis]|eukprot:XP_005849798.1 hypothetical protein CHLNCDRAFT_57228 [Chlorella variabilis]